MLAAVVRIADHVARPRGVGSAGDGLRGARRAQLGGGRALLGSDSWLWPRPYDPTWRTRTWLLR